MGWWLGGRVSRTHSRIPSNGQWPLKMKYCMIGGGMGCGGGAEEHIQESANNPN